MNESKMKRQDKHYKQLAPVYHGLGMSIAGDVAMMKRLCVIEKRLHGWAEEACSIGSSEEQQKRRERKEEELLDEVKVMLPLAASAIFSNGDPRGWALKIDDNFMRQWESRKPDNPRLARDWGGYGLISPDAQEVD